MPCGEYQVAVKVNNVKHAFPAELGIAFPPGSGAVKADALDDNVGGNTSALLVVRDRQDKVVFTVLVDAGMGTLACLAQATDLWPKQIDLILLTHGDIDHHSELVYICEVLSRLKKRGLGDLDAQPTPIPIYAPQPAADRLGEI